MQKNRKRKTLQELTLKDNFMFGAVMLEDLGNIPEELRKKIKEEQDMQTIKLWLKLSARVESIEQFIEQM